MRAGTPTAGQARHRLLEQEGAIERIIAPGGILDRLLDREGLLEQLVAEDGIIDSLGSLMETIVRIGPVLEGRAPPGSTTPPARWSSCWGR